MFGAKYIRVTLQSGRWKGGEMEIQLLQLSTKLKFKLKKSLAVKE